MFVISDLYPGGVDTSAIRYVPEAAFSFIRNYRITTKTYSSALLALSDRRCRSQGTLRRESSRRTPIALRISQCERDYVEVLRLMFSAYSGHRIERYSDGWRLSPELALARYR